MPCLHTYCKKCLLEAFAKRPHDPDLPRDRPAINCPLCRAEVGLSDQGIEALPTNFSATRLVETVQLQDKLEHNKNPLCNGCKKNDAIASCCDCGGFFLCANCSTAHKNVPSTKNHSLMTLKDLSTPKTSVTSIKSSPLCQKHPEELLKLYCQDCEILVCRDCVLVTHKTHNYSFVDDVIEKEKQQLKDVTLRELDKILTSTSEAINDVEQTQAKILSDNDQHINQLNKTFRDITDMANKHKKTVLDKINQMAKDDLSPLQKQQDDLTMLKKNVEKCRDFTSNTLHTGTNSEIMSARKQMLERTKHLKELNDGSQLSPVVKSTKTVSYQLLKINVEIKRVAIFIDPQQCYMDEVPLEIYEKVMSTLKVTLNDTKGQPICDAANVFTAKVTTAANNGVTLSVKYLADGEYSISFTPLMPVEHVVSIQINGMHIRNSPTEISCLQEKKVCITERVKQAAVWALADPKPGKEKLKFHNREHKLEGKKATKLFDPWAAHASSPEHIVHQYIPASTSPQLMRQNNPLWAASPPQFDGQNVPSPPLLDLAVMDLPGQPTHVQPVPLPVHLPSQPPEGFCNNPRPVKPRTKRW